MARIGRLLAVVAVFAAAVLLPETGTGSLSGLRMPAPLRGGSARARQAWDGVFDGSHSDVQVGSVELAYRVHRAQMGSAALLDLGLERVRRDDAGVVSGDDWALSLSVARAPSEDGSRYQGSLSLRVGDRRPFELSLDSARPPPAPTAVLCAAPDAGAARTC